MKKQLHIKDLGPRQLWKLRQEVIVNSVFISDYDNSFGIDPDEVCDFFASWLEDIEDQLKEEIKGYRSDDFFNYFPRYDNYKCLKNYASLLEW